MDINAWVATLNVAHYDEVWAVTHYLIHGADGKYRKRFAQLLVEASKGKPTREAFRVLISPDFNAFEKELAAWWLALKEDPTPGVYAQAACETLTSFLARAHAEKQKFEDADAFLAASRDGTLLCAKDDWLPPNLLSRALTETPRRGTLKLEYTRGIPALVMTTRDGAVLTGTFAKKRGRGYTVTVKTMRSEGG
jgi:hypothetical protein